MRFLMIRFIYSVFFLLTSSISFSQIQVYPTHWWIGMNMNQIQLMIHSSGNLSKSIKSNSSHLVIKKIDQPENSHYLFVDIQISPQAKAGIYNLELGDGQLIKYELKNRTARYPQVHQGVHAKDLVYLIMPDRFVNGDPSNDSYLDLRDSESDRTNPYARHGGDIDGVIANLDYLKNLGVTALWLTPVLENDMPKMQEGPWKMSGYHGYWTTNHYKIDKRMGGNQAYAQLVKKAHEKGIKIIQDAVYNHVGSYHHTVLDPPMKNWLNQWPTYTAPSHREELFIDPHRSQEEYKTMLGGWFVPHLPDLNLANPYCAKFIIQANIWSTEEFGIDGWRVDTYKYCDEPFLNTINAALLREYPQLTVFGEAWTNTVPASAYFTQNNLEVPFKHQVKGVTDFPLNAAIYDAINQPFGWTEGVTKLYMTLSQDFLYKDPMTNCIFLDNHDMNRFYSMAREDLNKYKMGLGLLLTLRGIPQVYYGTEVLMKNFKDPNDAAVRKDFPGGWNGDSSNKFQIQNLSAQENEAFTYFRLISNFRKNSLAIGEGKMLQYIPKNGAYIYFRIHEKQRLMCVLNTSQSSSSISLSDYKEGIGVYRSMENIFTGTKLPTSGTLQIPAQSFIVYELKDAHVQ